MHALAAAAVLLAVAPTPLSSQAGPHVSRDFEALPFLPRHYVCYHTPSRPTIDGRLDEAAWRAAPWTDPFVDIEGDSRPRPRFQTRAKMLWDADYFYVGAEMEEPDVWGSLTSRDSIVYNDNDFELFVDPDGDTHLYDELEVNPLGTVFDLMLPKPYRDGGPPIIAWDVAGLGLAVNARGTINQPADRDEGWTVEIAVPWKIPREAAPGKRPPQPGEQWRVNFSRVEWQPDVKDGRYSRRVDVSTGRPVPADNWVWSPQGVVDMHMPERWGFVQFSRVDAGAGTEAFVEDAIEQTKWALRRLYYRQRRFRAANGRYADDLKLLNAADIYLGGPDCGGEKPPVAPGCQFAPVMQATRDTYQVDAKSTQGATAHIRDDGKVWVTR